MASLPLYCKYKVHVFVYHYLSDKSYVQNCDHTYISLALPPPLKWMATISKEPSCTILANHEDYITLVVPAVHHICGLWHPPSFGSKIP